MSVDIGIWGGQQYTTYTNPSTSQNNTFTQNAPGTAGGMPLKQVRVINNTSGMAFVSWGMAAQTATTSSVPFGPGVTEIHDMGMGATNIAVLAPSAGAVYIGIGGGS